MLPAWVYLKRLTALGVTVQCMLIIPALRRLRQKFQVSLDTVAGPCLKKTKKNLTVSGADAFQLQNHRDWPSA